MPLLPCIALLAGAALFPGGFAQDEVVDDSDARVLVVGTLNAPWIFRSARYTPAHLRAVLAAFDPDVIALQCPPEWIPAQRFLPGTYEGPRIALPWSVAHGAPVHGIDVMDLERWEAAEDARIRRHAAMLTGALAHGPLPLELYGFVPAERLEATRTFFERPDYDFLLVNEVGDPSFGAAEREAHASTPDRAGGRNQRLAARCLEVVAEHPGAKLCIFVGSGHKAVLDVLLAGAPGVRVVTLGGALPAPTGEEFDAAWTPEDLVATLGHNLDGERSYFHPELVDLHRMQGLVERLARTAGCERLATYFQARIAYQSGELERALELLDGLEPAAGDPALYPYPMGQWRMRYGFGQALRLERARTLAALGRTDEARELLTALYAELPAPPPFESQAPAEGPAVGALGDPGFEAELESAAQPAPGRWWSEELVAGRQSAARDEAERVEGAAALRLEVLAPREIGRATLSQEVLVDEPMRAAREVRFDVRCRTEGLDDLTLSALVRAPDDGRLVHLAQSGVRLGSGEWSRATLRFRVPEDAPAIELHLSYDALPGARLWLDDAGLFDDSAPPFADWGAAILAREFPRTLLAGL